MDRIRTEVEQAIARLKRRGEFADLDTRSADEEAMETIARLGIGELRDSDIDRIVSEIGHFGEADPDRVRQEVEAAIRRLRAQKGPRDGVRDRAR